MFYSPLRYPGGKNRLSNFIAKICVDNGIDGHYVEPYAGGAGVALNLLIEKRVNQITINDFDKSIYAFWFSVLNNTKKLCRLIEETPITIDEWKKQKAIQKRKNSTSLLRLGFSTFFLNRTNISGIINAGPIGGINQKGKYKIDCRFNKDILLNRIRLISSFKRNIHLYNLDALDLIKFISKEGDSNTIFYFDPPYFLKGPSLYMNFYNEEDHKKVSREISKLKKIHWVISYDDTTEINEIYNWVGNKKKFNLIHNASRAKRGKEILFFSNSLKVEV
ncbi:MAG: DNA adenine methylase [bacterium]